MLTVLPVPAFLSTKVPVAEATVRVSPETMPVKVAEPVLSTAEVLPS